MTPDLEALSIEQLEAAIAAKKAAMVDPLREALAEAYKACDCRVPRVPPSTHFLDTMTAELRARGMELAPQQPVAVPVDVEALAQECSRQAQKELSPDYERISDHAAILAVRATLTRVGAAQWPGEDILLRMARECAALAYDRIGEIRNAQQARYGLFDEGILPRLAFEAMLHLQYYIKHGDVPPTCPQAGAAS